MNEFFTNVVHGESGVGKSWYADTSPGPRVIFDVEGGTRWTPSRKVMWDGIDTPPVYDGTWDTCIVPVRKVDSIRQGFQWLNSGRHPFRSAGIDSLTEVQKRVVDEIVGSAQMQMQDWGTLLRKVEAQVRAFRDVAAFEGNPLQVVTFVCTTAEKGKETVVLRPGLQGQLGLSIPYFVDVVTYLTLSVEPDGYLHRKALFQPVGGIVAKDRTNMLGTDMLDPTIPKMLDLIFPKEDSA